MITVEQAKAMVGTEFIYVFEDGDEILAYVKAFDPEVHGLTCYTLDHTTRDGWKKIDHGQDETDMPDGTWCVIGGSIKVFGVDNFLKKLEIIKTTGRYVTNHSEGVFSTFAGCAF